MKTKTKTVKAKNTLKYFSAENYISYKLKKGTHTIDLGEAEVGGKDIAVYLKIESEEPKATYSCDLISSSKEYEETRTIPNNVTTSWHYVPTNENGVTNIKIRINSTSSHKDLNGLANILIIN